MSNKTELSDEMIADMMLLMAFAYEAGSHKPDVIKARQRLMRAVMHVAANREKPYIKYDY